MISYIEEYESFTLDDFTESIISQKIFNINENEILSRLAKSIKHKFASLYASTPANIFARATLADSTYKSQSNVVFTTDGGRSDSSAFRPKPRMPQRPTILNWFKRDPSKCETAEKKPVKQECVEPEDQPQTSIVPIDIDPFGTLVISGEMLSFPSESESDFDEDSQMELDNTDDTNVENADLKCLTISSIANNDFPVDEDAETCVDTNSLNNFGAEHLEPCKSLDFDISDQLPASMASEQPFELTGRTDNTVLRGDNDDELNSQTTQESPINSENTQWAHRGGFPATQEEKTDVKLETSDEKVELTHHLGNNILILYGGTNNVIASYWLVSKVFECDLKSLITATEQEHEFIGIQNKKVQHVNCKTLETYLSNELIPLDKLKETLLSRHSQISVLEHFEHLSKHNQMLLNKWFSKVYEKVFILLVNRPNRLDFRIKSHSLMFRINGLDRDKFIEYTHKQFLKLYHNNSVANTSGAVGKDTKFNYCLSRLNIIEIANRVDFDVVLFYNTLIDSQKNYFNALRKHKIRVSHRLLRNVIHVVLNSHSARSSNLSRSNIPSANKDNYYYYTSNNKDLDKIISDIISDYGAQDLDSMLSDFYFRLFEIGNPDLQALKPQVNHLIAKAFLTNDLNSPVILDSDDHGPNPENPQIDPDDVDELALLTKSMKLLVEQITALVNDFKSSSI